MRYALIQIPVYKSAQKKSIAINYSHALCLIEINQRRKKALNNNVQCFLNILSINQKESNVKSEVGL